MSNFKTGEKVVCIDVNNQLHGGLVLNEIYEFTGYSHRDLAIYVKGFNYPHYASRFRKLDYEFAENLLK